MNKVLKYKVYFLLTITAFFVFTMNHAIARNIGDCYGGIPDGVVVNPGDVCTFTCRDRQVNDPQDIDNDGNYEELIEGETGYCPAEVYSIGCGYYQYPDSRDGTPQEWNRYGREVDKPYYQINSGDEALPCSLVEGASNPGPPVNPVNPVNPELGGGGNNGANAPLLITLEADTLVAEGDDAVFTVRLSFAEDRDITIDYRTIAGTATPGRKTTYPDYTFMGDYHQISGTITISAGDTVKTISVPTRADGCSDISEEEEWCQDAEGDETFSLELTNPSDGEFPEMAYSLEKEITIRWLMDGQIYTYIPSITIRGNTSQCFSQIFIASQGPIGIVKAPLVAKLTVTADFDLCLWSKGHGDPHSCHGVHKLITPNLYVRSSKGGSMTESVSFDLDSIHIDFCVVAFEEAVGSWTLRISHDGE